MRRRLLLFASLLSSFIQAQTFTGSGGSIPDGGPLTAFPITVSGLSPAIIDSTFGLESVCINITHSWDADLNISVQAPDGTIIDLSTGNGGDQDNYTNTCFNASASTPVSSAGAPFSGTFRPHGFLGMINNGQSGNGVWKLLIQDTYPADAGSLLNWKLTFGNSPAIVPFVFTSSNLPIVVVNTGGVTIPNEPKLDAHMGIIYNGPGVRNNIGDPFNNYNNKIGIELRGSSSLSFPQKSYAFETRNISNAEKDTMILGMPQEHDWILYAPYDDKTCMRNVLSYDIANKTGHYASRTKFCELVINGQYQGIYVMMEKIKRDNNRVDIAKLTTADISGDDLTGGYILKTDRDDGPGTYWTSQFPSSNGNDINFVYVYPKPADLVPQQRNYIQSYVDSFEVALSSPTFSDPLTGYRKYADVNSFIDYLILDEISKNVDGYRLSAFFYKDKQSNGGKLMMGPAWDYNLAWWNADYCNGDQTTGWAYQFNNVCGDAHEVPFWWTRMMQDPGFKNSLKCRWLQLRTGTLSTTTVNTWIDSVAGCLNEAQTRHFTAWPILGTYTWPNPSPIPADFPGEITALKTWVQNRFAWLDAHMPGTCVAAGIADNSLSPASVNVYPNPFSGDVTLQFYLPAGGQVKIELKDLPGKTVGTIEEKEYPQGDNTVTLHFNESELNAGIYLLKLSSANGSVVKKITKVN